MITWSRVCTSCTLLLYALGTIGGPELNPTRQRSASGRSSGLSKRPRAWASRCCAAAVIGGIRPSGGSTTREGCFATRVPRSHQKSLYARSTSAAAPPSRRSLLSVSIFCCANSSASSSVSVFLPAKLPGRSSGVSCAKSHMPCRSGRPSAVRGTGGAGLWDWAARETPAARSRPAKVNRTLNLDTFGLHQPAAVADQNLLLFLRRQGRLFRRRDGLTDEGGWSAVCSEED